MKRDWETWFYRNEWWITPIGAFLAVMLFAYCSMHWD